MDSHQWDKHYRRQTHTPTKELCPTRVGLTIILNTIPLDDVCQDDRLYGYQENNITHCTGRMAQLSYFNEIKDDCDMMMMLMNGTGEDDVLVM